jgi:hypothetical protein
MLTINVTSSIFLTPYPSTTSSHKTLSSSQDFLKPLAVQDAFERYSTDLPKSINSRTEPDMSSNVLVNRDINATVTAAPENMDGKVDVKSMEYHRQVLQSKIDQQQYVLSNTSQKFSH